MYKKVRRLIRWYQKKDDKLAGEENLPYISLDQLAGIFQGSKEDPYMFACYEIKETHKTKLQKLIKHKINLLEYDYFLEADAEN